MKNKMPKKEKKFNVKDHVEDNTCDLNLEGLTEVPVKQIAMFKRVTILDLSSNKLVTLGDDFAIYLKRLVKLDLSKNQIESLPDEFGQLVNLRHLDLYDNKIEHLPLSFGDLKNLRYLDLKNNPLAPALVKVVGMCLTNKDCHDSARQTVKFLSMMQEQALRAKKEYYCQQMILPLEDDEAIVVPVNNDTPEDSPNQIKNRNKKNKKNNKKKGAGNGNNNNNNNNNNNGHNQKHNKKNGNVKMTNNQQKGNMEKLNGNNNYSHNHHNGSMKGSGKSKSKKVNRTTTARSSILIFLFLLAVNLLIVYLIRFKNPEIADKLVEVIPPQYRDWIVTKSEIFRLRVTDWISEFRTPPEEN